MWALAMDVAVIGLMDECDEGKRNSFVDVGRQEEIL